MLYCYSNLDFDAMLELTVALMLRGVGFRAVYDENIDFWSVELTGAN